MSDEKLPVDLYVESWLAWVRWWNGTPTSFNPSGRRFKKNEIRLMAQQEAFDQTGISGFPTAGTAEELLERAKAIAAMGKQLR